MKKLSNIAVVIIAAVLLAGAGFLLGQRVGDTTTIKVVLADMTVHANTVERQNAEMKTGINSLRADLAALKSEPVDRVLRKYGM